MNGGSENSYKIFFPLVDLLAKVIGVLYVHTHMWIPTSVRRRDEGSTRRLCFSRTESKVTVAFLKISFNKQLVLKSPVAKQHFQPI